MSAPAEIALLAYDEAVNAELGNPPGTVFGERNRKLLHANPAIKAMLDAHEHAIRQRVDEQIAAVLELHTPVILHAGHPLVAPRIGAWRRVCRSCEPPQGSTAIAYPCPTVVALSEAREIGGAR
jgi:hypothetical protein